MGSYPVVAERLSEAYELHKTCLDLNFRTSPIKSASFIGILVGSIIYVFAGPLIILSRSAFYQCAMIGSVILAFSFLLVWAAGSLVTDCLRRTQSLKVDDEGHYAENLRKGALFEVLESEDSAYTSRIGLYLSALVLIPLTIMGISTGRILGRPV